jgi:FlaA1/EpsC-like NDP-sugar epimerase
MDAVIFLLAPLLALILRLDGFFNLKNYLPNLIWVTLVFLVVKLLLLLAFGVYQRCWRYASIDELQQIASGMLAAVVIQTIAFTAFYHQSHSVIHDLPRSLPILDGIISFLLVVGLHFSVRTVERISHRHRKFHRRDRVLIVGAGSAGIGLVQEMQRNPSLGLRPVAFVDDDPTKLNLHIRRLPVVGNRYKIPDVVRSHHIRRVIIAMPTAPGQIIRETLDICQRIGIPTSTLPGIDEILNGRVTVSKIRDVELQDLLRRDPIQMDVQEVRHFLNGKRVLITGAGGSIGSEICRQVLKCQPTMMILVGHGENSVFNIQQELEKVIQCWKEEGKPTINLPQIIAFIADIRFLPRLELAFEQFRPQIVLHAAAHKHVPMMELNAPEAITNNVFGTRNLLDMALKHNVENFVMISTDKAVNPTNFMGASKRVAEMLVLQAAQTSQKPYVVVRFGNVLGSRGSVIPTFKRQIAEGGPVTVTHPEICRYFMTIPEAVQLVLQAATLGQGGEVFMLNMGQPVKIVDLARELIQLSGYEVGKHIDIVFTGLRPGEKLYEELFLPGETYEPTKNQKLFVVANASHIVPEHLNSILKALHHAALNNDSGLVRFLLEQLVPGYTSQSKSTAQASAAQNFVMVPNNDRKLVKTYQVVNDQTEAGYNTTLKMKPV